MKLNNIYGKIEKYIPHFGTNLVDKGRGAIFQNIKDIEVHAAEIIDSQPIKIENIEVTDSEIVKPRPTVIEDDEHEKRNNQTYLNNKKLHKGNKGNKRKLLELFGKELEYNFVEPFRKKSKMKEIKESKKTNISIRNKDIENLITVKGSYKKTRTTILYLLLVQTSFLYDMIEKIPHESKGLSHKLQDGILNSNPDLSNYLNTNIQNTIKFLYHKFKYPFNKLIQYPELIKRNYNLISYIENLLFCEYLTVLFPSQEGDNIICINGQPYKIYTGGLHDDIFHGADIILTTQQGDKFYIDITTNQAKPLHTDEDVQYRVLHYHEYKDDFYKFIHKNFSQLMNNNSLLTNWDINNKGAMEETIANLINKDSNYIPST